MYKYDDPLSRRLLNHFRYLKEEECLKALYKNILCQAIEDATCGSRKTEKNKAKKEAIDWLLDDEEDFREVCGLAGLDPFIVRMNVRVLITSRFLREKLNDPEVPPSAAVFTTTHGNDESANRTLH